MSQPERRSKVRRVKEGERLDRKGQFYPMWRCQRNNPDRRTSAPVAEALGGGVGAQAEMDIGKLACDFETELCAQVAESAENDFPELSHAGDYWNGFRFACEEVACRIRLRLDQRAEPNHTDNGEA